MCSTSVVQLRHINLDTGFVRMSALEIMIRKALPYVGGVAALGAILLTYMLRAPQPKAPRVPKPVPTGDASLSKYEGKGPVALSRADSKAAVRYAPQGLASKGGMPAMTIPQVFKLAAEKKGDKIALRSKIAYPHIRLYWY